MKILPHFTLTLIFVPFIPLFVSGQNVKEDSLLIEKLFLHAIGKPEVIDSLQITELKSIGKAKNSYILEDTYWYNLSKSRFLSGQLDEAFEAANKGIELSHKKGNSYRTAKFHNLKASVFAFQKNNEKAIAEFKTSLSIVERAKDLHTAAQIRNNIANVLFGLSDYTTANKYISAAYEQLSKEKDTVHLPGVTGIYAITSLKLSQLEKGKKLAEKSLFLAKKYNNPIGLIVGNHSMGEVYNTNKEYKEAIFYFDESLKLSELYQQDHFIMLNKLGLQHAMLMVKDYNKSIQFGKEALDETNRLQNQNTLYAIHKNLGYAYAGLEKMNEAFQNLALAHDYYIKSAGIENQKTINDILIRYDTEKKEKELIHSQLIISENQNKLIKRAQWITILGIILAIVVMSYFYYNRIQNQKVEQLKKVQETKRILAAISAEEKERERISNELHDGMASSITGIKLKLEDFSKDEKGDYLIPIVNQLIKLHDETRRISHNLMPLSLNQKNWIERIQQYCRENTTNNFIIQFSNHLKKTIELDPNVSIILYRSLQELIHNAQKHSESKVCYVQLSQLNDLIVLSIEDEGIGFDSIHANSQGLNSLRKRLSEIGGELEIDSKTGKGSLLTIYLNTTT